MTIKHVETSNISISEMLKSSKWSNALSLSEKYNQIKHDFKFNENEMDSFESESFSEWVDKLGGNKEVLKLMLKEKEMPYQYFLHIIKHKDSDTYFYPCGTWFTFLKEIFNNEIEELDHKERTFIEKSHIPFKPFLTPFLKKAKSVVSSNWKCRYNKVIEKEHFIQILYKVVCENIIKISLKTLIYELNKKRLKKELIGETSEERYSYFVHSVIGTDEKILSFLLEYPVLGRLISESVYNITTDYLSILNKLCTDSTEIENKMGIQVDKVKEINSLGDLHKKGKSVLKITFQTGSIIYKPRSLQIDEHFQLLINWFNNKKICKNLKQIKILNKNEYGWMEFIQYKECNSIEEVRNFYIRQGEYLAILYLLNATDFHYENIVASGEFPYLVDLESLFHNDANQFKKFKTSSTNKANKKIAFSVVRSSLLPVEAFDFIFDKDISGLGGGVSQQIERHGIENFGRDDMRIVLKKVMSPEGKNTPKLNGKIITYNEFIEDIKLGFSNAYKLILNNIDELKGKKGPIQVFTKDKIRVILRNTIVYSKLLEASSHPKYLKNGIDREKLFLYLWRLAEQLPERKKAILSECEDIFHGDIPYFATHINSKKIYGYNEKVVGEILNNDSLSLVHKKISNFGESDLRLQSKFIDESFKTSYFLSKEYNMREGNNTKLNRSDLVDDKVFLNEAIRIGDILYKDAVWGSSKKDVTWLGMGMNEDEKLQYKVMDMGIYNGNLGMTLFFAYLGSETNIERFTSIAKASLNTALTEEIFTKNGHISAFSGYGASIYVLSHLHSLWKDEDLINIAKNHIDILSNHIHQNVNFDLLNGLAGSIIVLLNFFEQTGYKKALEIAKECGNVLIQNAVKMDNGIGWRLPWNDDRLPLAGLSHGVSGVALALLKLYSFTSDENYLNTALSGIHYENSLYSSEENNWRDLRVVQDEANPEYSIHWCNGCPGIGLGRLQMLDYYKNHHLEEDIQKSIEKTLSNGFTQWNYSLCHGDLGNLDLVLQASIKFKDKSLYKQTYQIASHTLHSVKQSGGHWKCGIPGGLQTPNFMVGLSGIGYQLLRLYNNELPSIIGVLEPPKNLTIRG